jgi:hypothetical protein
MAQIERRVRRELGEESEHRAREERRDRRLALERRLDKYRTSVFTPSGRPYDELPVVTLTELRRKVLNENVCSVGAGGLSGAESWR